MEAQRKKLKRRSGTIFKDGVEMLPFLSQFSIEVQAWEKGAEHLVVAQELEGEASGFGVGTTVDLNLPTSAKVNFEDL